ncbi:acyl-CoA dehydrogenase family protein [Labrenzia sp. PHM005]|uniref:acyl-CoA dehydrogenase family protein n=1 Tax=Labrenzia sp. PHM005 TaxID=2590016 RepID=UPI00113FC8EA|nr:acyl-CoA dehydrogenase family protein [Labrenzia sp. PHM005]QDG74891.1 DNA alkylation response protein [Labrenzia sp. PHM005]
MNIHTGQPTQLPLSDLAELVAPDCHGANFFDTDTSLKGLLALYLPDDLRVHLWPHLQEFGALVGDEIDTLSRIADRHVPVLHHRDPRGRFEDWIEFHPAYKRMEQITFGDFAMAGMTGKPGVFGWPEPMPHTVKFLFQYLLGQSEFGQLCPISMTETTAAMIRKFGDEALIKRFFDRLISQDPKTRMAGGQFMTERHGGSDVSQLAVDARHEDGTWRLYGEKWFCSAADADVVLVLARPEGAPAGNKGLAVFALPKRMDDGSRNSYRIVRLKDKLGTLSMASGEVVFEGAIAYPLGDVGAKENPGLKMMMNQVSLSRLSHGARAASMMRRCLNEALTVAKSRTAFREKIIDKPLLRRQLMKLMIPTEQALSMTLYLGTVLTAAGKGDKQAERVARILTPAHKYRTARDNIRVATGAMEVRGGNGYIEDFVNARLVRDAHVGLLWEGTSNINALDITTRAIAKAEVHLDLKSVLQKMMDECDALPETFGKTLRDTLTRSLDMAETIARSGDETLARKAASAVYHSATAVLLACEGAKLGATGGDARRLLMARMVIDHRLAPQDPLSIGDSAFETAATDCLLNDDAVPLERASDVLNL